jgi:hypothetical protein
MTQTKERARVAFGAARAFPIRQRYLLGHSDPLKRWPQATLRPSGESSLLRIVTGDRSGLSRTNLRRVPWEAPALPSALGRSGPARKVARPLPGCQTIRNVWDTILSGRSPQVAGNLDGREKTSRVTNKTQAITVRNEVGSGGVGQVGDTSRIATVSRLTATSRPLSSRTFMSQTAVVFPMCRGVPVAVT